MGGSIKRNEVKYINLQIQEAEWIPNSINPKKSMPSHITKLQKIKTKNLEPEKKNTCGNTNSNDIEFLIWDTGGQKEVAHYLSTGRKNLKGNNRKQES